MAQVSPKRSQKEEANREHVAETRLVPIRVLYTLNISPQYLLARQRRRVQAVPIREDEQGSSRSEPADRTNPKQRYARVALKTCLQAVCNSSPELLADRARDYSVYVVDPLEATPNDAGTSHAPEQSIADSGSSSLTLCPWGDGVSIGMGLMSWCLAEGQPTDPWDEGDDEEGYVVGKLVNDRGSDALEIVMSLRETTTQTQRQHALSLSSWGLQAPFTAAILPGHSSPSATQQPSPFPTSPSPSQRPIFPSSQTSTVSTSPEDEYFSELEEAPRLQAPSSSATDLTPESSRPPSRSSTVPTASTKRIGRPPGSRTHPEKRARRLAIQTHREKLERLEHIARMQRGEKYDKTLVQARDLDGPKVTDEEIVRQQKLLEELEARPLIVDQLSKGCLTNNPLPKRAPSKKAGARHKGRSATPSNAVASGSGVETGETQLTVASANSMAEQQGLLLSLLTSVLGKVDAPSAANATTVVGPWQDDGKGKTKQTFAPVNDGLAGALQRLLPLLPDNAVQSSALSSGPSSHPQVMISNSAASTAHRHVSPDTRPCTRPHSEAYAPPSRLPNPLKPHSLFTTTEEAFYSKPLRGPNWPHDEHWAATSSLKPENRTSTPKVHTDADSVAGGGWARGRKLMPRDSLPSKAPTIPSDVHTVEPSSDLAVNAPTEPAAPDKENLPPAKKKRALKRSLSSMMDPKEHSTTQVVSSKSSSKKRKQEAIPVSAPASEGTKRIVMGSAQHNKTGVSRKTGVIVAASSPVRSTAFTTEVRSLPVMAMSEPDSLPNRLTGTPLIASWASSNPVQEPPRTPPRRDRLLDDDVGGSLFTPCAPECTRLAGSGLPSDSLLFSPSPVQRDPRSSRVEEPPQGASATAQDAECPSAASGSRRVSTGWDLPPSSPPPPTSPILPNNDIGPEEGNQMDLEFAMQLQREFDVEMEKTDTDGRFEDLGKAINSDAASTPAAGTQRSIDKDIPPDQILDFDAPFAAPGLGPSSDDTFDFGELAQVEGTLEGSEGIELDIDELWGSLGPVIAHAQTDVSAIGDPEALTQREVDFDFFGLGNNQTLVEGEGQSGVDPVKLAEDLKALFGGCVV